MYLLTDTCRNLPARYAIMLFPVPGRLDPICNLDIPHRPLPDNLST